MVIKSTSPQLQHLLSLTDGKLWQQDKCFYSGHSPSCRVSVETTDNETLEKIKGTQCSIHMNNYRKNHEDQIQALSLIFLYTVSTVKQTLIPTLKLALVQDLVIFWIVICSFLATWKEHDMNIVSNVHWTFAFLCLEILVLLEVSLSCKAQLYKSY